MTRSLKLWLAGSHLFVALLGSALGIYLLPILTAPPAPSAAEVRSLAEGASFTGQFRRDLKDSDPLHWGEGTVSVGPKAITLVGRLAPGPDYKLYLSAEFAETRDEFLKVKRAAKRIGDVKTFENFIVPVPSTVNPGQFTTAIVWCESFSQFITAAQYKQ